MPAKSSARVLRGLLRDQEYEVVERKRGHRHGVAGALPKERLSASPPQMSGRPQNPDHRYTNADAYVRVTPGRAIRARRADARPGEKTLRPTSTTTSGRCGRVTAAKWPCNMGSVCLGSCHLTHPGGLDRRTSGFQPESWPQGQTHKRTPIRRVGLTDRARLFRERALEDRPYW